MPPIKCNRDRDLELADINGSPAGQQRRRGGLIARPGGCGEFRCVTTRLGCLRSHLPASGLLGVVALLAEAEPAGRAGGSAATPRNGVVAMADGRVAVWSATTLIPEFDEPRETAGKQSAARLECHQRAG